MTLLQGITKKRDSTMEKGDTRLKKRLLGKTRNSTSEIQV